jgi:nitrogen fixation protein FixH
LVFTALSTLHGEELANSYDASQVYNQRIAEARAQDELGWVANVTTRQEGESERVVADFRDRAGAPIPGLEVRARFVHPFDRQADREAILASDGGAYEGVAGPLHSGRWTLVIEAKADGREKFTSRNKITLAETASGD